MSGDLTFRMICDRIARGEATGILCPADQAEGWVSRLQRAVPLLQRAGGDTLYFHTGAVVRFCSTPDEARAWERGRGRPVLWIDDDNVLDAPLPAPKRENEDER